MNERSGVRLSKARDRAWRRSSGFVPEEERERRREHPFGWIADAINDRDPSIIVANSLYDRGFPIHKKRVKKAMSGVYREIWSVYTHSEKTKQLFEKITAAPEIATIRKESEEPRPYAEIADTVQSVVNAVIQEE